MIAVMLWTTRTGDVVGVLWSLWRWPRLWSSWGSWQGHDRDRSPQKRLWSWTLWWPRAEVLRDSSRRETSEQIGCCDYFLDFFLVNRRWYFYGSCDLHSVFLAWLILSGLRLVNLSPGVRNGHACIIPVLDDVEFLSLPGHPPSISWLNLNKGKCWKRFWNYSFYG